MVLNVASLIVFYHAQHADCSPRLAPPFFCRRRLLNACPDPEAPTEPGATIQLPDGIAARPSRTSTMFQQVGPAHWTPLNSRSSRRVRWFVPGTTAHCDAYARNATMPGWQGALSRSRREAAPPGPHPVSHRPHSPLPTTRGCWPEAPVPQAAVLVWCTSQGPPCLPPHPTGTRAL